MTCFMSRQAALDVEELLVAERDAFRGQLRV
jgi:hypothetical protein